MNPSNISKTITKIIINLLNKHDIKYKYLCTDSGRVPRYEIHLMPLRKKLICYKVISILEKYWEIGNRYNHSHCLVGMFSRHYICVKEVFGDYYVKNRRYKTKDEIFYYQEYEKEKL